MGGNGSGDGRGEGLYKEGGGRVMDVFAKTCIIKTYLGNGNGND